jgi:hypothetical protein
MKNVQILLRNIDRRKIILILSFTMLLFIFINFQTKEKLESGYQFFLSFFSILINVLTFIFFMLVLIAQEERRKADPFYLFKYVTFTFLFILLIGPFLYLWSMREVILHLKW